LVAATAASSIAAHPSHERSPAGAERFPRCAARDGVRNVVELEIQKYVALARGRTIAGPPQ
jgi:hypothetical protein